MDYWEKVTQITLIHHCTFNLMLSQSWSVNNILYTVTGGVNSYMQSLSKTIFVRSCPGRADPKIIGEYPGSFSGIPQICGEFPKLGEYR